MVIGIPVDEIAYNHEKMNGDIPFCEYCREYLDEFNWEADHKNDSDYSSYVLKKKI